MLLTCTRSSPGFSAPIVGCGGQVAWVCVDTRADLGDDEAHMGPVEAQAQVQRHGLVAIPRPHHHLQHAITQAEQQRVRLPRPRRIGGNRIAACAVPSRRIPWRQWRSAGLPPPPRAPGTYPRPPPRPPTPTPPQSEAHQSIIHQIYAWTGFMNVPLCPDLSDVLGVHRPICAHGPGHLPAPRQGVDGRHVHAPQAMREDRNGQEPDQPRTHHCHPLARHRRCRGHKHRQAERGKRRLVNL